MNWLVLSIKFLIDFFCDKWEENTEILKQFIQECINCFLTRISWHITKFFWSIKSVFYDFNIIVAEVPEKLFKVVQRKPNFIFVKVFNKSFFHFLIFAQNPSVNILKIWKIFVFEILQVHFDEFWNVPNLVYEFFASQECLITKHNVRAKSSCTRPISHNISRILVNRSQRFNLAVSLWLAYLFALVCHNKARNHNIIPRSLSKVIKTLHNGIKIPSSNDFRSVCSQTHWF